MTARLLNTDKGFKCSIPRPSTLRMLGWAIFEHLGLDPWSLRLFRILSKTEHRNIDEISFEQTMAIPGEVTIGVRQVREQRPFFRYLQKYLQTSQQDMSPYLVNLCEGVLSGSSVIESLEIHKLVNSDFNHLSIFLNFVADIEEIDMEINKNLNSWLYEAPKHRLGPRSYQFFKRVKYLAGLQSGDANLFFSIHNILSMTTSNIRVLNLAYTNPSEQMLRSMIALTKNLEVLQVLNLSHITIPEVLFFTLQSNLSTVFTFKSLEVENCGLSLHYFDLFNLRENANSIWERLRTLNLRMNNLQAELYMDPYELFKKCQRLVALDISKCGLTRDNLINIIPLLPKNLTTLNISGNTQLCITYFEQYISDSKLQNISIQMCEAFDPQFALFDGFGEIEKFLIVLPEDTTVLDFTKSKLCKDSLRFMQNQPQALQRLKTLHFGEIDSPITDSTYFGFLKLCTNLEDFSIKLQNLQEYRLLLEHLQKLPKLKRLSLWWLDIDRSIFPLLKKTLRNLTQLEYFSFKKIQLPLEYCLSLLNIFYTYSSLNFVYIKTLTQNNEMMKALTRLQSFCREIYVKENMIYLYPSQDLRLEQEKQNCNVCEKFCGFPENCNWQKIRNFAYLRYSVANIKLS